MNILSVCILFGNLFEIKLLERLFKQVHYIIWKFRLLLLRNFGVGSKTINIKVMMMVVMVECLCNYVYHDAFANIYKNILFERFNVDNLIWFCLNKNSEHFFLSNEKQYFQQQQKSIFCCSRVLKNIKKYVTVSFIHFMKQKQPLEVARALHHL